MQSAERLGGLNGRPLVMRNRTGHRRVTALAVLFLVAAAACGGGGGGERSSEQDDPTIDQAIAPGDRAVQVVGAGKVRLYGTLAVPTTGVASTSLGVLIVPSAGSGTRDGQVGETGANDGLAKELAAALGQSGTVSYRYDRRGTAESKIEPDVRLSLDDLVADARAGLDLLEQRRETSGRELAVVGYGDGGLVALRLAATDSRVKRLVLISTPGRTLVDAQAAELAALYGPESAAALRTTVASLLATKALPSLDAMRAELRPLLPPQDAAFLAQLYQMDPAAEAAKVKARSLIVVGRSSAAYDPDRLRAALAGAEMLVVPTAGSTLVNTGPAPTENPGDPASPVHEHGAAQAVAPEERDAEAMARIGAFLTGGRTPS